MARKFNYKWYKLKKALRPYAIAALILVVVATAYALFPDNEFIAELAQSAGITENEQPQQSSDENADCVVTFVNVGRADCAIIQCGGETALIDGGDIDTRGAVTDALKALGVERIDKMYLTHPHSDHIGCMPYIIENYPVGQVYFTSWPDELSPDSVTYERLLEAIDENNVPLLTARTGDVMTLGDGRIEVLYAGEGEQYNLNNHSLVLRFKCGKASFMFMGDAERGVESVLEKNRLNLGADVLKVGHHGSKYGSTEAFLRRVHPDYAVINCLEEFNYDYPDDEAVLRLESAGAKVLRTDVCGSVRFTYKNGELTLDAER